MVVVPLVAALIGVGQTYLTARCEDGLVLAAGSVVPAR